jgi:SAM-dependent methyltransferase
MSDDRRTQSIRWMWSLGDYVELARYLEPASLELVDAVGIRPGMRVLDVAAGNGNFAIAAARKGAQVVASDLTPTMIELGRERAGVAGVSVEWVEADAGALPFEAERFEVVASVFGAMFAFDPEQVAAELFRVARPGGTVAMANYSSGGFLGAIGRLLDSLRPPAEASPPSPFLWGDPSVVRERFGPYAASLETHRRIGVFEFASLDEAWRFWERTNPPMAALKAMLPGQSYASLAERARGLMAEMNAAADGRVRLEWDWLLVLATKPS